MAIVHDRANPRADLADAVQDFNSDDYQFIAEQVLPVRDVRKKAANYSIISAENNSGNDNTAAKGSRLNKIVMMAEDDGYKCVKRGLAIDVLNEDADDYADDYDAEVESTQVLRLNNLINKEIRVAAKAFDTTVFSGATKFTDMSSAPWSDSTSDIVAQLKVAKIKVWQNCGFEPDSMAISYEAFEHMMANNSIMDRIKSGVITMDLLAAVLAPMCGIRKIHVGKGQANTADEGQSYVGGAIWSPNYCLVYKSTQQNMKYPGLGWSFNWLGNGKVTLGVASYGDASIDGITVQEVEYRDEKIHENGRYAHLLKIN